MKIKTKKQMTYGEYAKYMIDKVGLDGTERKIIDNNIVGSPVEYEMTFTLNRTTLDNFPKVKYCSNYVEIEVKEEVNGETILDKLYEVSFCSTTHDTNIYHNTTVNSLITSTTALVYTVINNKVIVLWERYAGGFR